MLTQDALTRIYYSLSYPNLIYCHADWGSAVTTKTKRVVTAQMRALRTIGCLGRGEHTNDIFSSLNVLKFPDINTYCCSLYVYKSINSLIENRYLNFRNNDYHHLRNPDLLRLPQVRSTQSQSFIGFHGVRVWNGLPFDIRSKPSVHSFKSALKTYLLSQYSVR